MLGLPILVPGAMPTNLCAGTNEDRVILTKPSDRLLFEGLPQLLITWNTFGDTMTALLRMHR